MSAAPAPHLRLVNDIAAQFRHRPPEEAAEQIAAHLRKFWDPRMRDRLLADAPAHGADLDPLALRATELLRR